MSQHKQFLEQYDKVLQTLADIVDKEKEKKPGESLMDVKASLKACKIIEQWMDMLFVEGFKFDKVPRKKDNKFKQKREDFLRQFEDQPVNEY